MSYCRVLVDEWVRCGLTDAVISPGSRSTPLVIALAERMRTHVVLDERSASYVALGLGLATGRPAIVACTSGTAATHFHAAVVEASQANVPLVVCTANRPPELIDVGAPQTIDQHHLYGAAVRWFSAPGTSDSSPSTTWRSLAARAAMMATGPRPGPVHLDLAFREPLIETDHDDEPEGRPNGAPWHQIPSHARVVQPPAELAALFAAAQRPLLISGHLAPAGLPRDGVPVLGDHRGPNPSTVPHWDLIIRSEEFVEAHEPDLVVRAGMPPASTALRKWLHRLAAPQVALVPPGRWIDPDHNATWILEGDVHFDLGGSTRWAKEWIEAGRRVGNAITSALRAHPDLNEPATARLVFATRPAGSTLVTSSSMPIRDLETFAEPRADLRVLANRGANGIDGVTSTAIGVALSGVTTTLLIGDLALLHDASALNGITERSIDLTIVVVDNRGGGIFSLLPQHDALDHDRFEQLFGTPQAIEPLRLLQAHGVPATKVTTVDELVSALGDQAGQRGVRAIVVPSNRAENLSLHQRLGELAIQALE